VDGAWVLRRPDASQKSSSVQAPRRIPDEFFGSQPAHALDKAAFNLAPVNCRVNALAHVVQDIGTQHAHLSGEGINDHFGTSRAIGKVIKRPALQLRTVVMNLGRGIKPIAPELYPGHIGTLHQVFKAIARLAQGFDAFFNLSRGQLCRLGIQIGTTRGGGGRGIGYLAGVTGTHPHLRERHPEFIGHHLGHLGKKALAHLGAAVVHKHTAIGIDMHQGTGLIHMGGRKRDTKLHRRECQALL